MCSHLLGHHHRRPYINNETCPTAAWGWGWGWGLGLGAGPGGWGWGWGLGAGPGDWSWGLGLGAGIAAGLRLNWPTTMKNKKRFKDSFQISNRLVCCHFHAILLFYFIPEQFTVKAHPALFEREGWSRSQKMRDYYSSLQ